MASHKGKIWLVAQASGPTILKSITAYDPSYQSEVVVLAELEIEIHHRQDDAQIAAMLVEKLEGKIRKVQAEAYKEEVEIKQQIQQLLGLSYIPADRPSKYDEVGDDDNHPF